MYSVLSQLTIQPQHVDEFIALIREHASESLWQQNQMDRLRLAHAQAN